MGFENEAERSLGRPCRQADGRSKRVWQSHRDEGVKLARSYAPSLAWLLPVPKAETPPSNQMSAAAIATEVEQQLEPIARGFDVVQRSKQQLATSIEQLATKIDELAANQVTQNSATLQAVEQDNSQTTSSPPPGASTTANAGQQVSSQTTSSPPPGASTTADAGQQVSDKCDIEACKQAYFTFNPADCTYQPNNGPRRRCTK
jgi:TolA-binding protein